MHSKTKIKNLLPSFVQRTDKRIHIDIERFMSPKDALKALFNQQFETIRQGTFANDKAVQDQNWINNEIFQQLIERLDEKKMRV